MAGDENLGVPGVWEMEVLEEHVAEIVFDSAGSYDPDCVLCRRAVAAGLFERYGGVDGDGDGEEEPDVSLPALFDPFVSAAIDDCGCEGGDGVDTDRGERSVAAALPRHAAAGGLVPSPRPGEAG